MGVFITLTIVISSILLYKYKGRLSPIEKERKNKEKQQYILSKIKKVQESKRRSQQELITGLPNWDNDNEAFIR
jgi:Na+-transporting NADH:ubiquinone oxidoreductase subunit NqrC